MSDIQPPSDKIERPHVALRRIVTRYFIGLIMLALAGLASFYAVQTSVALQARDAQISQLINTHSEDLRKIDALWRDLTRLALRPDITGKEVSALRQEIYRSAQNLTRDIPNLLKIAAQQPGLLRNSHPIEHIYRQPPHQLEPRLNRYLKQVMALTSLSDHALLGRIKSRTNPETAVVFDPHIAASMRAVIHEAKEATNRDLGTLTGAIITTTALTMAILLLQAIFIFLPLLRQLREESVWGDRYEAELHRRANEDQLTGIANRLAFQERLEADLARASEQHPLNLILFDLNGFKQVNDTLGHPAGDWILQTVARRGRAVLSEGEFIARLGGDEFAIISSLGKQGPQIADLVSRLAAAIKKPVEHDHWSTQPSVSFGGAVYPDHARSSSELFAAADAALYLAKREKTPFRLYDDSMRVADADSRQISRDLRQAIPQGQLTAFYQPKFDISAMRPVGFEAQLRWQHPSRGLLAIEEFESTAKRIGLYTDLCTEMMDIVARDIRRWLDLGRDPGFVAINIPENLFAMGMVGPLLATALDRNGVPYERICVQVTENVLLNGASDKIAETLSGIRGCGMRVALDDFGTNHASLRRIKDFPFDMLKIDSGFVSDIGRDEQSSEIVHTLIGLAHSLEKSVIAEGIETVEQCRHLQKKGCQFGQGSLYATLMPFDAATEHTMPLTETSPPTREMPGSQPDAKPLGMDWEDQGVAQLPSRAEA